MLQSFKMLLFLVAVAALVGNIQAFTTDQADNYIDGLLQHRFKEESQYSRLDPYKLDDIHANLSETKGLLGEVILDTGTLKNLSSVRRLRSCTTPLWVFSNVTFTCFLNFDQLDVFYDVCLDITGYEHSAEFKFSSRVAIKGLNITIQITSDPEDDIPNLKLLFINQLRGTAVTADLTLTDYDDAGVMAPQIRNILEKNTVVNIHRVVNGRFKNALAYSIYKTPLGFVGKAEAEASTL